jgi:hypothetical protein
VPETFEQVQTSSHVKTVAEVARNSALRQLMLHVLHAQRVPSSKSVLLKLMAQPVTAGLLVMSVAILQVARLTATAMTELRKAVTTGFQVMSVATLKTVAVTRAVQSAQAMATAMIVVLVVETVRLMVVRAQLQVAATVAK